MVHGGDDALGLSSADESLADLQQAESEGEEEEHTLRNHLSGEQTKLEFMAALGLVPPAILEEIQRRQQLCRAEYGNWWDRLHSTVSETHAHSAVQTLTHVHTRSLTLCLGFLSSGQVRQSPLQRTGCCRGDEP